MKVTGNMTPRLQNFTVVALGGATAKNSSYFEEPDSFSPMFGFHSCATASSAG